MRKWKRPAGLLLLGMLSAAVFAPTNLPILLWLCLPLLLRDIDLRPTAGSAFFSGWLFGTGHFAVGFYWIGYAFLVDAERFGLLMPFAVGGLAAFLGLYIGVTAAASRLLRPGWPRLLLFAAIWGVAEYLRGKLFSGFPWNPIGSAWSGSLSVMQIASVIGVPGLGMLTLVLAGTPVLFWQSRRDGWRATVFSALMVGLLAVWGAWRIPLAPVPVQPDIRLRLVQASIAQSLKWQEGAAERNFLAQIRLSLSPAEKPVTDIIWPETAVQFYLDIDENARRALADIVPQGGLMLVGAVRGRFEGRRLAEIWNSLQVVDKQGALLGSYDKAHLVPYGEYMPLPKWLPLSKLTVGGMDFSPGPGPRTLDLPGLPPVAPMICYDDVFPTEIVDPAHRPGWMLLVTNDAWFGVSSGPYQHFAASRMRAVEQGLPLVRAANTGISGAIDPYGRVLATLGLGETGVLDVDLPQPLAETIFARWGNRMMILLLVITVGLALSTEFFGRRRRAS